MIRTLLTLLLLPLLALSLSAQEEKFGQYTYVNLGVGLSDWGIPFIGSLDFTAGKDFTLGFGGSYQSQKVYDDYTHAYWNFNLLGIRGQANYHFGTLLELKPHLDLYAGLSATYYIWRLRPIDDIGYWEPDDYGGEVLFTDNGGIGLSAQAGLRYFFATKAGVHLELGTGTVLSTGTLGFTFRF